MPQQQQQHRYEIEIPGRGKFEVLSNRELSDGEAYRAALSQSAESTAQNIGAVTGGVTPGERLTQTGTNVVEGIQSGLDRLGAVFQAPLQPGALDPVDLPGPFPAVPKFISDLGSGLVEAQAQQGRAGVEAFKQGDLLEAQSRLTAAAVPLVGPFAREVIDESVSGQGPAFALSRAATELAVPTGFLRGIRTLTPSAAPGGFPASLAERMSPANPFKKVALGAERVFGKTFAGGPIARLRNVQREAVQTIQTQVVDRISTFRGRGQELIDFVGNSLQEGRAAAVEAGSGLYQQLTKVTGNAPVVDMSSTVALMEQRLAAETAKGAASPQLVSMLKRGISTLKQQQTFMEAHGSRSAWGSLLPDPGDTQRGVTERVAAEVKASIEEAMERAARGTSAESVWREADAFWKENVVPFYADSVRRLAKDPAQVDKAATFLERVPQKDLAALETSLGTDAWGALTKEWIVSNLERLTVGELREGMVGGAVDIAERFSAIRGDAPTLRGSRVRQWVEGLDPARRASLLTPETQSGLLRLADIARVMEVQEADLGLSIMAGMINAGIIGAGIGVATGKFGNVSDALMTLAGVNLMARGVTNQTFLNALEGGASAFSRGEVGASVSAMSLMWDSLETEDREKIIGILGEPPPSRLPLQQLNVVDESLGRRPPPPAGPPLLREQEDPPSEQF